MAIVKNEVRATFIVKEETDVRRFRGAVRKMFHGTAEDEDVAYLLDNVVDVRCGKPAPNEVPQ